MRCLPLLPLFAVFAPFAPASAVLYTGDAVTQSALGSSQDALALRVQGKRVSGVILSNAFSRRLPVVGTLNAAGRLRLRVAAQPSASQPVKVTGRFSGRLRASGLRASGRASNDHRGRASFRLTARLTRPTPGNNGAPLPDLTGTRRLYAGTTRDEYRSINFTFQKEGAEYSYRAVFADSWHGTDKVDARTPVPTGDLMDFTNSFEYRSDLVFFTTVKFRVYISRVEEYYFTNNYEFTIGLNNSDGGRLGSYILFERIGPDHAPAPRAGSR